MKWITREKPKIDRVACPWLIKRFIDPEAEFFYVPFIDVKTKAAELNAIPFDIPDVEYTHYEDQCTFDYIVKKHNITDVAVLRIASVVRGADTDRHDISPQSAGLWAISAGLSHMSISDHEMLERGMVIYDALYSWAKYHYKEKHTLNPSENLLADVYEKYLKQKKGKKAPAWVAELKELIQDQVDANITLKQLSQDIDINPTYLSRKFSEYFENMSFGEYLRKTRIDKAIEYLDTSTFSLTKIAYLTGFSDQSHFTRIFRKQTGMSPSKYRKRKK